MVSRSRLYSILSTSFILLDTRHTPRPAPNSCPLSWLLNDIAYTPPEVPTLYTALTSGDRARLQATYNSLVNPILLGENETVEIILNNHHMGRHPFHLHGHHFQAIYRSEDWAGPFVSSPDGEERLPTVPIRRDTIVVNPGGSLVLRFKADNPGGNSLFSQSILSLISQLVARCVAFPLSHGMACSFWLSGFVCGDAAPS